MTNKKRNIFVSFDPTVTVHHFIESRYTYQYLDFDTF